MCKKINFSHICRYNNIILQLFDIIFYTDHQIENLHNSIIYYLLSYLKNCDKR